MFFLATAAVFLLAAAVQAGSEQQLRVVRTQVRCGDGQRCPKDNEKLISGELRNITYGQKNQQLSADFVVNYHSDGTVDYTVTAKGSSSNPVRYSTVVIGSGGPKCELCREPNNVVSFTGLQFNQCGYTQTFDGNKVHRTIVVKVRHHFTTGALDSNRNPVDFIGYRDITVDFWLEAENVTDTPPIIPPVQRVDDELEVCVELTHQLVTLNSGWPYFWHVKITALDYVPQALGLGFNLERCWVVPYLRDGLGVDYPATFLVGSVLDQDVLFNQSIIPHYSAIPGEEYQFSFGQVTSGAVNDSMLAVDKKHQVHCSVCLCKLNSRGADACHHITPGNINGRSAFQGKSFRPLFEEAVLVAGYARQV